VFGRYPQRALAHPGHQDRHRLLDGCGDVALVGEAPPDLGDHRRRVHPALAHRRERQAGVDVLVAHVSRPDAQLEPPAGEQVQGGGLAGEQGRVPEVGVEHVGAQAHP
jgi:hypothetical protein